MRFAGKLFHYDITRDWSDHALWWPKKFRWLTHTRYGVTADALLYFTPMHKSARVELPDMQIINARLDFSLPMFSAVIHLCKELGIRHPEELSLKRYIDFSKSGQSSSTSAERKRTSRSPEARKEAPHSQSAYNISESKGDKNNMDSKTAANSLEMSDGVLTTRAGSLPPTPHHTSEEPFITTPYVLSCSTPTENGGTLNYKDSTLSRSQRLVTSGFDSSVMNDSFDPVFVNSPSVHHSVIKTSLFRPKSYAQKCCLNQGWLDSSRSLMEQGIVENQLLLLRFKYLTFFDINAKYDPVRINQLYEQARWAVLLEEVDSTEEEAYMFAALQLQVQLRAEMKQEEETASNVDDVDRMLNELENTLKISSVYRNHNDLTSVPELADYLRFMRPKKLSLKNWRRAFFTFRDLSITWYPSASESHTEYLGQFGLKGCEVSHEVNLAENKYCIKLLIPSAGGMSEFWLRCDTEQQYARWLAACKLAAKGKTMADSSFEIEVETIRRLLDMQHPSLNPDSGVVPRVSVPPMDFNPNDFLPLRYTKKVRSKQTMIQRIVEAHHNINDLSLTDAKLQYIRAWQTLPEFGIHYFVVRFKNSKKPDLLGISYNRLMKMNLETGDSVKTWRFSNMKRWHVNWEIKRIFIQFENEDVEFSCLSADCKVPHEFIGGYIFSSLRSKDQNQVLNEELFHRLTSGWA
ncbi:unnamed protein product [Soboliphyme baturini]|uniref:PH domain-containing protein n=1 Tax=Soboliphyme baturini TaxID=241478 RepID=A0A183IFZ9_9BILA|nr:unnamed protein product [Soboliphyme baturini]